MSARINTYCLIIWMSLLSFGTISCSNWLDVEPKSEIKGDVLFETEQGFEDAITGVYILMTDTRLYGKEMSYGFIEAVAQQYEIDPLTNNYFDCTQYRYDMDAVLTRIDGIWSAAYNAIANVNNILKNLETSSCVTPPVYARIKGECLGLRAFLHFDLLRLWGPIYSQDSTKACIPYREKFNSESAPLMAANEVMKRIVADLKAAEELLKNDPLNYGYIFDEPFVGERKHRMNKYAVKAMLARVYLYMGNKAQAASYAREVINNSGLRLVRDNREDVSLYGETIFGLSMYNMEEKLSAYWKDATTFDTQYYISRTNISSVFETNSGIGLNDMRYRSNYGFIHTSGNSFLCRKYLGSGMYGEKIPLIRLAEMYYILAESVALSECGQYINAVKNARGISRAYDVGTNVTEEQRLEELNKEYQKEFFAEGQYFYFLKRHNMETFYRCPVENFSAYVLPVPDDEKTYGEAE